MAINPSLIRNCVRVAVGALICSTVGLAKSAGPLTEAQARYRQDMAFCNSGKSNQDIATCRREARSALVEARRGGLKAAPVDQYQQNALQRCNAHQGDERTACEARMRDEGSVEGSVADGGILRKSEIAVPSE